ncbi:DUF748 domain-containing protein [Hydrogenophaga sp.]|uniref:DUF748 domain-containing protein n=1 Tax=Hydrogenophaga sp. TaxID=1904254 RepID=UPI0025BE62C2|nr:DUF748 domain-containing protein [Hydrogenophaga sp.]MBT9464968.1 DUF748 domain-containing protein [Hydrogenophaga sp.]
MSNRSSSLPSNPWLRRLIWAVLGVMLLWLVTWLAVPALLKWQLQKQASQALGRHVTVQRVDFRPWSLELSVEGVRMATAQGDGEQLSVARLYLNAELQSILRLAPVIDALKIEQPRLAMRHLGGGRYDVDDIVQRLRVPPSDPASEPARFALFNIELAGGEFTLVDDTVGVTHQLRGLALSVPFLSNLASRREVVTEPRLAFELNGSAFDSRAASTPFAPDRETDASLSIPALDLAPYFPYWPAAWTLKPEAGVLNLNLKLAFVQRDVPQVWLSGDVALTVLKLVERAPGGGATGVLSWERLDVKLNRVEPLARRMDLAAIELKAPNLTVSRDAHGQLNLARLASGFGSTAPLVPAGAQAPAAPPVPWEIQLGRLDVEGGRVQWRDDAVNPRTEMALDALRLQTSGLSWPVRAPMPFEVSAQLDQTTINVKGTATDVTAQAELSLGDIPLERFAPYISSALKPALQGRLGAEGRVEWQAAQGDRPMGLQLMAARIDLNELKLGPTRQPLASLKRLLMEDLRIDLAQRSVDMGSLTLTQPQLRVQREANGSWMFEPWLVATTSPVSRSTAGPAGQATPWRAGLTTLQIAGGSVGFVDRMPARPVTLAISNLQLDLKGLRPLDVDQKDMALSVKARVGAGPSSQVAPGQISVAGALRLPAPGGAGMRLDARVQAERLPAHALEPYFADRLNLELLRADASYRGTVKASLPGGALALNLQGDAALDELAANTLSPAEDLLAWKSLQVRGLQLALVPGQATKVAVRETVLTDYFARLIIDEAGKINLQGLFNPPGEAPRAEQVPPQTTAAASGPGPDIRMGPISLVNGRVRFSDRFIKPNYTANLSELTGSLGAFSNAKPAGAAPELAALSLRGRAEGTAALEIDGQLNPLAQPLALDIKGRVRNLELPPLSPYTVKYAGYGIERGKLSVDVAYKIDPDGRLSASNQIVLNQLSFGDRVAGSEAPNLPVKLAVALLADRNGVIDINLPVSGSINDPQFRLAPIIFKLIFNLIGKAITAPFSLIASAFGGGAEAPSQVVFAPGSAVLAPENQQRLESVAKALTDRPALQITVVGHSDLEAERSGYQRSRLDERVLAEKRRALAREGKPIPDTLAVSADEYPALLKEVYRRADIPKPRNLIGMAKDIAQPEMEALLLASIPVTPDALRDLAVARGQAVKDFLASRSLPEDRMFLGAPQLARQGDDWRPQAELRLAPR